MISVNFRILLATTLLFYAISGHAVEQLYSHQPPVTPELAFAGPYGIGVTTVDITDKDRLNTANFITSKERKLRLEIWYPIESSDAAKDSTTFAIYSDVTRLQNPFSVQGAALRDAPAAEGSFPLILLSHGFTGYRTQMFYLGEHLASHGYTVVGIDHKDSTNADVYDEGTRASGFISTVYNRARDQQFVLEQLAKNDGKFTVSRLQSSVDTNRAAIVGYSMGGFGALNTVGACFQFDAEGLKQLGAPAVIAMLLPLRLNSCFAGAESLDPRWKAVQLIAPWGGELNIHDPESMQQINLPALFVAGDQDNTSGFDNGVKKLFHQTGSKDKYLLVYENARHNIAGHPPPSAAFNTDYELGHYVEPSWDIETINRVNKHITLAFLDCHVKQHKDQCDYLPLRDNIQQYQGKSNDYLEPWPGFKHLWGSGIRFYRE